jgi:DNA polymerase III alpha subunit
MSIEFNTEDQLIKGVINHGVEILSHSLTDADLSRYTSRVQSEKLNYPIPKKQLDNIDWFMPYEYKNMDIEAFLFELCPKENRQRLEIELSEYRKRNLLSLLKQMKYIIDTLRKHKLVWGVGRGSSVASYTLFLLGVHKIDSVKYNLPLEEFFKGEQKCQQEV